jgi:HNH endonuclease
LLTDPTEEQALQYFESNYAIMNVWHLPTERKIVLAATADQTCRFCGRRPPDVSYKLEAHALPESIGNRSLVTKYECDLCNEFFGNGIENDFGNWSKPARTFCKHGPSFPTPQTERPINLKWSGGVDDEEAVEHCMGENCAWFEVRITHVSSRMID